MILAIDQGTSATKACVFEAPGAMLGAAEVPVERRTRPDGTVTQDPYELVESCRLAARAALRDAGVNGRQLSGAALANQGESFLLFDSSYRPLTPVIGWQDTRCGEIIERVGRSAAVEITERTGLPLHAEFVAPKLAYQLSQLAPTEHAVRVGTLDTWLINQLDPSRPYVTDRATASRTMLIGLRDRNWSDDLLSRFGVPREILPTVVPCDAPGAVLELDGIEIPLASSGYDMGLALLGHGCVATGETKATFGTCLGVMAATAQDAARAEGLLTTIAYDRSGCPAFALDGEVAAAGALVAWALRLGVAATPEELDALAASADDAGGVVVVPALQGLGAPHWRDDVRGAILGVTAATGRAELARAMLDAIAWSLRDVLNALRASGVRCDELRIDGGLTRSATLLRRCADVAQARIVVSDQSNATAYGAAALAMLAQGAATEGDIRAAAVGTRRIQPEEPPSPEEAMAWETAMSHVLGDR